MENKLTPLEKVLLYLDNAIESMKFGTEVKETVIICRDIVAMQLDYEKRVIIDSFNHGEQNVWDRDRDGHHFEFEGGTDYYNVNFKKTNNEEKSN